MSQDTLANGLRLGNVLVLEDEALVSLLMEDILRDMGAAGVEVFSSKAAARELASSGAIDCAILDVVVQDGTTYEIADILHERRIPFLFSSGSDGEEIPAIHKGRPLIAKPFSDDHLKAGILAALEAARGSEQ
jgi:DNA-binding response OmpR family regulator